MPKWSCRCRPSWNRARWLTSHLQGAAGVWEQHSGVWTLQRLETVAPGHPYIQAEESAEFYLNVRPGGRRPSPVCGLSAVGRPAAELVLRQVASGPTVPRAEGLGPRALSVPYEPHPVPVPAFSDRDFPQLPGEQFGAGFLDFLHSQPDARPPGMASLPRSTASPLTSRR